MKRILITGQNSYIGNSFEEWVAQWPEDYKVDKISLRNDDWKRKDWSKYDAILNVAGIAHRKQTKENQKLYLQINSELPKQVVEKAIKEGVNHLIHLSSMSIYGNNTTCINELTRPIPTDIYGRSKLQADEYLEKVDKDKLKIAIIRPPMVYGKKSPGNYQKLSRFAKITPIFPVVNNQRSMIYIDNLSELIRIVITKELTGYYYPQNSEFVNTQKIIKLIAKNNNHKIYFSRWLTFLIKPFNGMNTFKKVFGDLYYKNTISKYEEINYQIVNLENSIRKIEKGEVNGKK